MLGQPWKGYYLTAYGIAVKHGFVGTEEDWLKSLHGEKGAKAQLRFNTAENMLEWKTEEDESWTPLMSLSDLQTELEAATIAEAQMAATDAKGAAMDASNAAQNALNSVRDVLEVEKTILNHIENYGTTVNNAYVQNGDLFIALSNNRTLSAGRVKGDKGDPGDTGDSGVHIGAEAPTDPEKNVWIDTKEMAELSDVQKILDKLEYTDEGVQVDLSDYAKEADLAHYAKDVDWEENDETAAGFVKNRTHYTYQAKGIVENRTALCWLAGEEQMEYLGPKNRGAQACIEWPDGNAEVLTWETYGGDFTVLRSARMVLVAYWDSDVLSVQDGSQTTDDVSCVIGVPGDVEKVKKLDAKYIPDTIAQKNEMPTYYHFAPDAIGWEIMSCDEIVICCDYVYNGKVDGRTRYRFAWQESSESACDLYAYAVVVKDYSLKVYSISIYGFTGPGTTGELVDFGEGIYQSGDIGSGQSQYNDLKSTVTEVIGIKYPA